MPGTLRKPHRLVPLGPRGLPGRGSSRGTRQGGHRLRLGMYRAGGHDRAAGVPKRAGGFVGGVDEREDRRRSAGIRAGSCTDPRHGPRHGPRRAPPVSPSSFPRARRHARRARYAPFGSRAVRLARSGCLPCRSWSPRGRAPRDPVCAHRARGPSPRRAPTVRYVVQGARPLFMIIGHRTSCRVSAPRVASLRNGGMVSLPGMAGDRRWSHTAERLEAIECATCGARVAYAGTGRRPRYCSASCRRRGWDLRRAEQALQAGDPRPQVVRETVTRERVEVRRVPGRPP
jgi:hypothetical protein